MPYSFRLSVIFVLLLAHFVFGRISPKADTLILSKESKAILFAYRNYLQRFSEKLPKTRWHHRKIDVYDYDVLEFKDTFLVSLYQKRDTFHFPVKGQVTSHFGFRRAQFHYGTDIKLWTGDTVVAAFSGIVRIACYEPGYGNFIVISHFNGLESLYGHLSAFLVKPGDTVFAGQPIGLGGNTGRSTGSHLHFELRFLGKQFNTEPYFDYESGTIRDSVIVLTASTFSHLKEIQKAQYIRVRKGDSLWTIAKRYGVSVAYLRRLNGLYGTSRIYPGQLLRIR